VLGGRERSETITAAAGVATSNPTGDNPFAPLETLATPPQPPTFSSQFSSPMISQLFEEERRDDALLEWMNAIADAQAGS
jgi:hypothetical protein